jgi:Big-like domain-containing protein
MVSSFGALDPNPVAFGGKSVLNFGFSGSICSGTCGFTVGGTPVTVSAGSSGTSTITVTPTGGFTGNVNVTCPVAGLPPGVTCTPNPLAINVPGTTAVTGSLTVAVAAPSTTLTASAKPAERQLYAASMIPPSGAKGWWALSAVTGLGAMILLLLPGRKRYRAALGLGLVCVLSFTLGCSSSGGGGGTTLATTTTSLTASMAKVGPTQTEVFTITVTSTGKAANGLLQLVDGTTNLGSAVTVSNGSATINTSGLAPGTHSISAHYLGDLNTQASQSGTLNITFTGSSTFVIQATPAASNGSPTVAITIN